MKNWIKKQKYKIAIALCSILSIFTLFLGINKTYAYTDTEVSRTLNGITSITTIGNYQGYLLNDSISSYRFDFKDSTRVIKRGDVLLVNIAVFDSNNNLINSNNNVVGIDDNYRFVYNVSTVTYRTMYYRRYLINDTFNSWCYYISTDTFVGRNYYQVGINYYNSDFKYLILNIDITDISNVNTDYYYDTYYEEIETNYNTLLDNYNDLQEDYSTLEGNYNTLQDNFDNLQNDYNTLLSQKNALEQEIITKQTQINTLTNELNRLNSEYNNIINVSAPFNPNNIGVATVLFNNTLLDIPYNSFVIFDYFQIELDLFDFDFIDNYNSNSNHLIVTLNLLDPKDFGTLKYWCNMRDSVGDYLSIYYYSDSTLLYSLEYMNNEHTDNNGDMAPYYLESANNVNRVVFDFFLNDDYSSNNPYSNNTDYLIQYGTYSQGYNDGLNAANEYNDIIINNYQVEIQGYNDVIDNLHVEVTNLKQQINIKDNQIKAYQQGANDYNLNRMIWTIASTPFESFKQIWNVDFFGVNISTMITGFITGIIVLWIIKKFFL